MPVYEKGKSQRVKLALLMEHSMDVLDVPQLSILERAHRKVWNGEANLG